MNLSCIITLFFYYYYLYHNVGIIFSENIALLFYNNCNSIVSYNIIFMNDYRLESQQHAIGQCE